MEDKRMQYGHLWIISFSFTFGGIASAVLNIFEFKFKKKSIATVMFKAMSSATFSCGFHVCSSPRENVILFKQVQRTVYCQVTLFPIVRF